MLYAEGNALRYEIDVTQPVGSRIVNLTYKGAPLNPATQFLVVTNNYRASGGGDDSRAWPAARATSCCRRRTPAATC